ncbi:MAG: hypothetical protein AABW79_04270 [Nanoarchaeota archaeon]
MEYLKINYAESINGKKQLLQSEISLLEALKRAKNYQTLRTEEFQLKELLRQKLNLIHSRINDIMPTIPAMKEKKENPSSSFVKKRKDIELEIESLKERLSLLSS